MMTRQQAISLLAASSNDPVVAAWAAVFFGHHVPPLSDASPYDAWEAYQDLFTLGAISPDVFDGTDVKREFFSGRRPSEGDIQDALDSFHPGPQLDQGMEPMAKLGNPFGSKTALAPRTQDRQLSTQGAIPLGSPTRIGGAQLAPTVQPPRQEIAPAVRPSLQSLGSPMATRSALGSPMQSRPDLLGSELDELRPRMFCSCGEELVLKNDGGQVLDEDDMPQGNVRVIDAIFSADCPNPNCNKVWHCSVGEAIPADGFR